MIVVGTTATASATTAAEKKKDFQGCRRGEVEVEEVLMEMQQQQQQLTDAEAEVEAEESASMCERILADLEAIFRREEANILDFDIIGLADSTTNKSPVVYVDGHLALERWAVPHLYEFARRKVLHARTASSCSCWSSTSNANGLSSSATTTITTATDLQSVHQWTRILLLINPDLLTAWNLRREMIKCRLVQQQQQHSQHADELRFTALVLARKPKCASVFTYREWLLNGLLNSAQQGTTSAEQLEAAVGELVATELAVTLDASSRYARNYYAWSHRTWLLTVFLQQQQQQRQQSRFRLSEQFILSKVHHDLEVTAHWLEGHISDYSCFQHRQSLLQYLFSKEEEEEKRKQLQKQPNNSTTSTSSSSPSSPSLSSYPFPHFFALLQREFTLLESLFPLYADQESLLLHRRALLKVAVTVWLRSDVEKVNVLRLREVTFQRDHVAAILQRQKGSPPEACNRWQAELLRRYLAYLRRNLNWSFIASS